MKERQRRKRKKGQHGRKQYKNLPEHQKERLDEYRKNFLKT